MADQHLREGEETTLVDYLLSHANTLEELDRDMEVLAEYRPDAAMRTKFRSEQQREKTRPYENDSSFGRNVLQIMENARKHLLFCPECLTLYSSEVERRVRSTLDSQVETFQEVLGDSFEEFVDEVAQHINLDADHEDGIKIRMRDLDPLKVI